MRKDMQKQLAPRSQSSRHLRHQKLVVLHVLKKLNRHNPVKTSRLKLMINNIPCDNGYVCQAFAARLTVDILLL